jgi:hypothetical protein
MKHMNYRKPPGLLRGFPDAKRVKRKTRFAGGLRARWKDGKKRIYEWDYKKGTVERYDKTGQRHLGEYDGECGKRVGPPHPRRKVAP